MSSSTESLLSSIKGRIWLAAGGLAVLECVGGLGLYMAMDQIGAGSVVSVFVALFFIAFVTLVFGWWLSGEVLRPIDSLTLIAKSLERSPTATLPRTTGSTETDELLGTLHRNGLQIQNVISLMDDVAAGRAEPDALPPESLDKLGTAFQKLVSRVAESIAAQQELEQLRETLLAMNADIAGIRGGRLEVNFRARHELTAEIEDTICHLAGRLEKVARGVQVSSAGLSSAASEAKRVLQAAAESRDEKAGSISRGIAAAGEVQARAGTMARSVDAAIASFAAGVAAPQTAGTLNGLAKVAELNSRISESGRKIQKLRSGIAEFARISRTANELSRKSNLIALNTPLYTDNGADTSLDLIVNELSSLSERTDALSKEIRATSEALSHEVADLGSTFQTLSAASIESARGAERAGQMLENYQARFEEIAAIRAKLNQFAAEQSAEHEKISQISAALTSDRGDEQKIREAELQVRNLITLVEGLKDSVSDIHTAAVKAPAAGSNGNAAAHAMGFERIAAAPKAEENKG